MLQHCSEYLVGRFSAMSSMRAVEVVEVFPFRQFPIQIDIVSVAQELIEFFSIRAMGSLDLAVQLR